MRSTSKHGKNLHHVWVEHVVRPVYVHWLFLGVRPAQGAATTTAEDFCV